MKKIGFLTYHNEINDGGFLQAYSQANAFKNYFKDTHVEIIDYRSKALERRKKILFLIGGIIKGDIKRIRKYIKIKRFIKKEMPLSKEKLVSDDYKKSITFLKDKYDLIVVGSDEVWKSLCFSAEDKSGRSFPNIYFLSPELKCKKIAFAASANRCEFDKIAENNLEIVKKLLQEFHFIGVRDTHTIALLKNLEISKEIAKVPDPTFIYEIRNYDTIIEKKLKRKNVDINKPILCLRLGSDTKKKIELCKKAREHFKKKGYQIVSIGGYNKFADINLTGLFNPFEWASVYKFFDFCITDRFHGTVFCLKNGTHFLSVDEEEYYKRIKSKIVDLLEELSMLNHYLYLDGSSYNIDDIIKNIKETFSEKDIKEKVEQMKKKYYEALDQVAKCLS